MFVMARERKQVWDDTAEGAKGHDMSMSSGLVRVDSSLREGSLRMISSSSLDVSLSAKATHGR